MQSFIQYRKIRAAVLQTREKVSNSVSSDGTDSYTIGKPLDEGMQDGQLLGAQRQESVSTADCSLEAGEKIEEIWMNQKEDPILNPSSSNRDKPTNNDDDDDEEVIVVSFDGPTDPMNPKNWSLTRRALATLNVSMILFAVNTAAAIDSAALERAAKEFGASEIHESLATGLFLVGLGTGSLGSGPISEAVGRNPVYITTMALFMIFTLASALAPNIGSQLAFRLLAGFFGSTPLSCAGGSIADMWGPAERICAFALFTDLGFLGPVLGPLMGGWIVQDTRITWRWTEWTSLLLSSLVMLSILLFQPETNHDTILEWKARQLRNVTGDNRYTAPVEARSSSIVRRVRTALYRPFLLTAMEVIVAVTALYLAVVFIVLFGFLHGYDYVFEKTYSLGPGLTGTCFLGILVGMLLSNIPVAYMYRREHRREAAQKAQGKEYRPRPESQLFLALYGGSISLAGSLFWMAWTSYASISIWSPLVASAFFGFGVACVFIATNLYIIESYETWAASALAALTLVRYCAAGGMTVVGLPFYQNLGVHWTLTILGGISAALVPVPYVFYVYGPRLRRMCRYAPSD